MITIHIWRKKVIGSSKKRQYELRQRSRVRAVKMLVIAALVFLICWLPLSIYHILADFQIVAHNSNMFIVCHWLAISSACYNPIIYCWLNKDFRINLDRLCALCLSSNSRRNTMELTPGIGSKPRRHTIDLGKYKFSKLYVNRSN